MVSEDVDNPKLGAEHRRDDRPDRNVFSLGRREASLNAAAPVEGATGLLTDAEGQPKAPLSVLSGCFDLSCLLIE
jgi:hypothetical protein